MRRFHRTGVYVLVGGLLALSTRTRGDGVVVKNTINRTEVIRRSEVIFTARVLKVQHVRSQSPNNPKEQWVSVYRVLVEATKPLRGRQQLGWLFGLGRKFWIEQQNPMIPGAWVIRHDVFRSTYPLYTARRGGRIVVYVKKFRDILQKGPVFTAKLGWVDHVRVVPEVRRTVKKIEAARKTGHRAKGRCPPHRYLFRGKCLSPTAIRTQIRCPAGARLKLGLRGGYRWLGCVHANGKKHGPYHVWYPNRTMYITQEFRNGGLHGPSVLFWRNGSRRGQAEYRNGRRHGSADSYHRNGKVEAKGEYRKGLKVGRWLYFDDRGGWTRTVCFVADKAVWRTGDRNVGKSRKCPPPGP